jgi:hydrogenase nickel incorporation protein HypA/HybF
MHEYGLVESLLAAASRTAEPHAGARITRLRVSVGELAGVETALLKTAYDTFREGTPCGSAELVLTSVPARWDCPRCGEEVPRGSALKCPSCGSPARLAQGGEIVLERVELEVPENVH